ncbi:hypothetical protein [Methylobacterium nodulans]|nr:hypothetical protein [Methylobacterium nodulans]
MITDHDRYDNGLSALARPPYAQRQRCDLSWHSMIQRKTPKEL